MEHPAAVLPPAKTAGPSAPLVVPFGNDKLRSGRQFSVAYGNS